MQDSKGTEILKRVRDGDSAATAELMELVYERLRALARGFMNRRPRQTLQATDIVHEAFINLVDQSAIDCKDRTHFIAIAARAMRNVLVSYARRRGALKRGGGLRRVPLRDTLACSSRPEVDVLSLHEALAKLESIHERQARVVELRFFGGLDFEEVGLALGISSKSAKSSWYAGRAWLHRELKKS
jgi:RNA polymerase sigma factor (TIGR02999 family)